MIFCRIDAAEDDAACCGRYLVLPDAECSSGGVAVRLQLVVESWERAVWVWKPGAGAKAGGRFAEAGAETDDDIDAGGE